MINNKFLNIFRHINSRTGRRGSTNIVERELILIIHKKSLTFQRRKFIFEERKIDIHRFSDGKE